MGIYFFNALSHPPDENAHIKYIFKYENKLKSFGASSTEDALLFLRRRVCFTHLELLLLLLLFFAAAVFGRPFTTCRWIVQVLSSAWETLPIVSMRSIRKMFHFRLVWKKFSFAHRPTAIQSNGNDTFSIWQIYVMRSFFCCPVHQ